MNLDKTFRLSKSDKRLIALGKFPIAPKLSEKEAAELKITPASANEFKSFMIGAQLSSNETHYSPLRDPLWKTEKKQEVSSEEDAKKGKKGKKHRKMRKNEPEATE